MTLRNAFFDGEEISEVEMNVEQNAWFTGDSNNVNVSVGSGVEKEFASQRLLFDSNAVPASINLLISSLNFDGTPIYPKDQFGLQVYSQPSDFNEGDQLEVILTGANLVGAFTTKLYIFGLTFGGIFSYEVLTFTQNESQTTRQYFTQIVALMTQDFLGNTNTFVTGNACRVAGGRLQIFESVPMALVRDPIMAQQAVEPNMDFVGFRPANIALTLGLLLEQIAATQNLNANDLEINTTATSTRTLPPNVSGVIIGEKFKATTNNIQKVSILLSVQHDIVDGYNWSGSIVVGIRQLQTVTTCPTDIVPGMPIQFDPFPVAIVETSFTQEDLENIGIILTGTPQVVDFVFATSIVANPFPTASIHIGQFYAITISRSGDVSEGTIVLQEASNITTDTTLMRETVFSQNVWTDIVGSNLWFKVFTSAARIVNGTAYDNGIEVVSPKIALNSSTGVEQPYVEGHHSLLNTSFTTDNFVIVQAANHFSAPIPHPATGNPVFTRLEDIPSVSVVSVDTLTTLIDAGNKTIILGDIKDVNHTAKSNIVITGQTLYPGLMGTNTFTIIAPPQDILSNNLVGSILTPNTNISGLKYRIIGVQIFTDAYGDVNGDGIINSTDVSLALELDGYSRTTFPPDQLDAIVDGYIPMPYILRADVTGDDPITTADAILIQQFINLPGTVFPVGTNFVRAVITVESIFNPGITPVNMLADDPSFNAVNGSNHFVPLTYQVNIVSIWKPENLVVIDMRRFICEVFTTLSVTDITQTNKNGGTNTAFIPGNLLLGGQLENVDGSPYAVDMEVGTIIIELPDGYTQGEIDIFDNFIRNKMVFYDGSPVSVGAIADNQVFVSASVQSITKSYGNFIDVPAGSDFAETGNAVSVYYIQSSGTLRIRTGNIINSITRPELRTKIVLTVYLKKAGFKNVEQTISETQVSSLLTSI